ncbi:type II toxin-antitoxin system ParD family antitoxin [Georhizobium sp. MAB10]|jgi:antitoxin ParD1/3/4|uniref:type II toxin-antitoxin system ParD family antitoxin n=1 Tax=Georhizobium sp. MAB10 TaxID=3028319 RepID=UPI003855E108
MSTHKRSIVIGEYFDGFIESQIASGRFNNASEVVRAALRLLETEEAKLAELRALIAEGDADIAAGRYFTYESADDLVRDIRESAKAPL